MTDFFSREPIAFAMAQLRNFSGSSEDETALVRTIRIQHPLNPISSPHLHKIVQTVMDSGTPYHRLVLIRFSCCSVCFSQSRWEIAITRRVTSSCIAVKLRLVPVHAIPVSSLFIGSGYAFTEFCLLRPIESLPVCPQRSSLLRYSQMVCRGDGEWNQNCRNQSFELSAFYPCTLICFLFKHISIRTVSHQKLYHTSDNFSRFLTAFTERVTIKVSGMPPHSCHLSSSKIKDACFQQQGKAVFMRQCPPTKCSLSRWFTSPRFFPKN